ncbi:type I polyketide synthase [Sciscionella sediminilitoris]|uniref:type I polyketide synthase n=1 Tax=Sciscionella sediminilitoris TaxID=1445613 RepID=UPI000689DE69|nr:type I polyketide synthase [Sciscionella sp. SE31]
MTGVAIVGMAALFPGSGNLDSYWANLRAGVDAITEVPAGRWDTTKREHPEDAAELVYCRRGGFIDEHAEVDLTRFGIMPNSVADTEPDQLIALHVAAQAIEDSGGENRLPDRGRIGVVLGRGGYIGPSMARYNQRVRIAGQLVHTLGELLPELSPAQLDKVRGAFTTQLGSNQPESAIGLIPNLAASRLANRLDLGGPAYTVDAACASSLVAVDQAIGELHSGRCDLVLAGGMHHCHDITFWSVFAQLGALSRSERIRPFHRDADGILIGEGTGMVALKRLADAERDGDRIYAVLRGSGVSSDGKGSSLLNPDHGGQVRAVRQAWERAGLDPAEPDSVGLLEAHGTATPAGDGTELATLATVFGAGNPAVIGSVKSMIGHTMPAAGIAGLIKAALAVHHRTLPPTLHCTDPHPLLAETRFRPTETARPWEADGPRRAAVNAFGFGGINAHVVLEEHAHTPARASGTVTEPEQVLQLAASDPRALAALLDREDTEIRGMPTGSGPSRLSIVDPTKRRLALARKLLGREDARSWRGRNDVWFYPAPLLGDGGKLAYLFPGLEAEFTPNVEDVARRFGFTFDTGGSLVGNTGRHGHAVAQLGRSLDGVLRRIGIAPDGVAGHSIGEWTAMTASGMHRAEAIDEFLDTYDPDSLQMPDVAFAAIGTSAERVREALAEHPGITLSHDNAPNQSMVCGPAAEVEAFVAGFRARQVMCQVLPFRSGFHTPMLAPYLDPIRENADRLELHRPNVPIWSATTAEPYPESAEAVRELFVRHLLEPVRFRQLITAMYQAGYRVFVQAGTGQLTSLVTDTLQEHDHLAVAASSGRRTGMAQLRRVTAAVWAAGGPDTVAALESAGTRPRHSMRLNLGSPTVALDDPTRDSLRSLLGAPRATGLSESSALDAVAASSPMAAEFRALLHETADSVGTVLAARQRTSQARLREFGTRLRVSIEDMPYLLDHCFFRQRADWPELADRFPVLPATTMIAHLMRLVEQAVPGRVVIGLRDVVLNRWITALPASELPVTGRPVGDDLMEVRIGEHASLVAELAERHPAESPAAWAIPPGERAPEMTAAELYTRRWMFHGPRFQGVVELLGIGERHARAVLITPEAPGALLDNVGQVLGYWVVATLPSRASVFPARLSRIRFHGPHPEPGKRLHCTVRITAVTDTTVVAEAQLSVDGRVWAEFGDWTDRRFDNSPQTVVVERWPERNTLSLRQNGGWTLLSEHWTDLASRELVLRNHLGLAEREEYENLSPRERRAWLLHRIAIKDAARIWLWDNGWGPLYPAEIGAHEHADGHAVVYGVCRDPLPELDVRVAHSGEVAVAIAGPAGSDPGIGIEPVTDSAAESRFAHAHPEYARVTDPWRPGNDYLVAWTTDEA